MGKRKALQIAQEHCIPELKEFRLPPKSLKIPWLYQEPKESCWVVYAPWFDGKDGKALRSSRIIMISKKSGEILYDGSANDEG